MTKPVVIAFDPATACGCAVGPIGGKPALATVTLGRAADPVINVFGRAASLVHTLIDDHGPILIAVEEPFFKKGESNYDTTVKLQGLYGAITGAARARNVTVWPVAVSTWRSVALGTSKFSGRDAAKKAMQEHCRRLGWSAEDDNAADAAGIWIWASAKFAPFGVIPK